MPEYVEAHVNLGNALAAQGQTAAAVTHYMEALRLQPGYAEIHYNIALALLNVPGRGNEAAAQLEAYLRIRPGNEAARQILARIRGNLIQGR